MARLLGRLHGTTPQNRVHFATFKSKIIPDGAVAVTLFLCAKACMNVLMSGSAPRSTHVLAYLLFSLLCPYFACQTECFLSL